MSHIDDSSSYKPYTATISVYNGFTEIFVARPSLHSGNYAEAMYGHIAAVLYSPFIIGGCVLEPVADTVTFPYDVIIYNKKD